MIEVKMLLKNYPAYRSQAEALRAALKSNASACISDLPESIQAELNDLARKGTDELLSRDLYLALYEDILLLLTEEEKYFVCMYYQQKHTLAQIVELWKDQFPEKPISKSSLDRLHRHILEKACLLFSHQTP